MKTNEAMKQHPDALFREKLEQHSIAVPQNAWKRIEKKIPSSYKFFIWKVAAAILILIVSIALLLPTKKSNQLTLRSNNTMVEKQNTAKIEIPETTPSIEKKEDIKSTPSSTRQIIQKESSATLPTLVEQQRTSFESPDVLPEEITEGLASLGVSTQFDASSPEEIEVLNSQTISSPDEINTTIVLTAAEVNTKYLLSPSVQATSEAETTSSFRKLINKAASFKNNTSGLAALRQKKNEMLALNTEKLRNRNEKNERNN
jgi:hypothetical protein